MNESLNLSLNVVGARSVYNPVEVLVGADTVRTGRTQEIVSGDIENEVRIVPDTEDGEHGTG